MCQINKKRRTQRELIMIIFYLLSTAIVSIDSTSNPSVDTAEKEVGLVIPAQESIIVKHVKAEMIGYTRNETSSKSSDLLLHNNSTWITVLLSILAAAFVIGALIAVAFVRYKWKKANKEHEMGEDGRPQRASSTAINPAFGQKQRHNWMNEPTIEPAMEPTKTWRPAQNVSKERSYDKKNSVFSKIFDKSDRSSQSSSVSTRTTDWTQTRSNQSASICSPANSRLS